MKTIKAFIIVAISTACLQAAAAIECRPGMGNCPGSGGPGDEPKPAPVQNKVTVIGNAEVSSPDCTQIHLDLAIHQATAKAIAEGELYFGKDAVQSKEFRYYKKCEQGIYANSAPGNSWIVMVIGEYSRPKP